MCRARGPRRRAGLAENQSQGHRLDLDPAALQGFRAAVLDQASAGEIERRDHGRREGLQRNGPEGPRGAAPHGPGRDRDRRHGDGLSRRRRSDQRGDRHGRPGHRRRNLAQDHRGLEAALRQAVPGEVRREIARLRHLSGAGALLQRRAQGPGGRERQESARRRPLAIRADRGARRHAGDHGLRRGRAGDAEQDRRLRHHRNAVGQSREMARGFDAYAGPAAELGPDRLCRQRQVLGDLRSARARPDRNRNQDLGKRRVGRGRLPHPAGPRLQCRARYAASSAPRPSSRS